MAAQSRVVRLVLWLAVLLTIAYWVAWYADRSLVASNSHSAYYQFENAFPLADGWWVLCFAAAAIQLRNQSRAALFWLLAGGGAGLYLFGMDSLYDAEHGIWWRSGAGGVIEAAINVATLGVSAGALWWSWWQRDALLRG